MSYNIYVEKPKKKSPLWLKIVGGVFSALVLFVLGFCLFVNFTYSYHEVLGTSMYPTLNQNQVDEDYVYTYNTKDVQRGDIIVYRISESKKVIKRLVGLGGDHILVRETDQLENGYVVFELCIRYGGVGDWQVVDDSYVSSRTTNYELYKNIFMANLDNKQFGHDDDYGQYLIIPENHFFALGDNRLTSYDCADYGPVSNDALEGKVVYVAYQNKFPQLQALWQFLAGAKWK